MVAAFGDGLKDWRTRRRCSQLDLGLNADVSARHISFLETGRSHPSRSMVLTLCDALDVPKHARNQLMTSAGFAPAYASRRIEEDDMTPVRQAVDWMLQRHAPYPALAMDRHWNVVSFNKPAQLLLTGMGVEEGDSLLAVLAENQTVRNAIINLEEVVHHTIERLRTESSHLGGDPVLDAAIVTLRQFANDNQQVATHVLPAFIPARYRLNGQEFSFFSTFTQFGTAEDIALSEMKIEMMFPADEQTRALLEALG